MAAVAGRLDALYQDLLAELESLALLSDRQIHLAGTRRPSDLAESMAQCEPLLKKIQEIDCKIGVEIVGGVALPAEIIGTRDRVRQLTSTILTNFARCREHLEKFKENSLAQGQSLASGKKAVTAYRDGRLDGDSHDFQHQG